jgi:hypothetical protein
MENVLHSDHAVYRNLKPEFKFNLCDGEMCHVAEVIIKTDKPKPAEARISLSNDCTNWTQPSKFSAQSEDIMK